MRKIKIRKIFILFLYVLLLNSDAFVVMKFSCLGAESPVVIRHADRLRYEREGEVIIGEGNVDVEHKEMRIKADWTKYDMVKEKVFAEGNVILYEGGEEFHGTSLLYDLKTEKGILEKPYSFLDPWFCEGERMTRISEGEYHLQRGSFTTCDLPEPHYRFRSRRAKIYPKKRFWTYHTTFRLRDTPLFYLPIYRRSLKGVPYGFIMWPIGCNSKKGWYVLTHYNWYVNPRLRGRIYLDYIEELGYGKGLDTHYTFGPAGREGTGFLYGYFIDENPLIWNSVRGRWEHGPPPYYNVDRWKLHIRHKQRFSKDTTALLRVDKFSDADFNTDYEDEEIWRRFLTREELEDQSAGGSVSITQSKPKYTLQTYLKKRINDYVGVVTEKLPEISFNLSRQRLGRSSLYWDYDGGFIHFHQAPQGEDIPGDEEEAEQADGHLEISRPSRIRWLRYEPAIGGRVFWYNKDRYGGHDRWMGNYELSLGMNTKPLYSPIFQPRNIQMRHLVQPRLTYYYSPEPTNDREDVLSFCSQLSGEKDYVNLELINRLTGKEEERTRDLAIFTLSSRLYRNREFLGYGHHAWGDLVGNLKIRPVEKISFDGQANYDVNSGRLNRFSTGFGWTEKKWNIHLGTNYSDPEGEGARRNFDTKVRATWQINPKWKIELYDRSDWSGDHDRTTNWKRNDIHEEWRIAVTRDLHCWEGQIFMQREWQKVGDDEVTMFLAFRLKEAPGRPLEIPLR